MVELITILILASLFLFLLGIAGGWMLSRREQTNGATLRILVGVLVTIVWAVSIAAEIIIPAYTMSVLIHGIMGAVVGYLFSEDGINIRLGNKRD